MGEREGKGESFDAKWLELVAGPELPKQYTKLALPNNTLSCYGNPASLQPFRRCCRPYKKSRVADMKLNTNRYASDRPVRPATCFGLITILPNARDKKHEPSIDFSDSTGPSWIDPIGLATCISHAVGTGPSQPWTATTSRRVIGSWMLQHQYT